MGSSRSSPGSVKASKLAPDANDSANHDITSTRWVAREHCIKGLNFKLNRTAKPVHLPTPLCRSKNVVTHVI
jgi:hypothetical protein